MIKEAFIWTVGCTAILVYSVAILISLGQFGKIVIEYLTKSL